MFISPAKPQMDVVSLRDNVFTFAATDFAPWLLQLNQINTTLFIHQQRLHDMSLNQPSLKSGWPPSGSKQEAPGHGLPVYGSGYYPETQNTGNSLPPSSLGKAGEGQSMAGNRTTRSSVPSYVSHAPPSANTLDTSSELLHSSYWQVAPPGAPGLAPFAHGGDPIWEHANPGVNPSLLEYGDYTLDVHASVLPQTVFRHGEALHDQPLAPMVQKDSSTSSKLYASSDMLEAIVLNDGPSQSLWNIPPEIPAGYGGSRCVEVSESDVTSSSWAEPEPLDAKTVSPKMLRIRQSPSPSSSCESIRTSFLTNQPTNQQLTVVNTLPSQASKPGKTTKESRTLFRDRGPRPLLPSIDMSGRPSSTQSDPPSPMPRKLTRLRPKPKPKLPPATSFSPPPPVVLEAPQTQFPLMGSPGRPPKPKEPIDLADRSSKDDFLVRQKQMGKTYKEIRRMGGFTEAESTLRGRYRTLTKCREARVRKPEWSEKDLHLLDRAVRSLAYSPDLNPAKVPWKKVAEYIVAHGGSYHFGNSTCRKRWDELVREQALLGKGVREPFFGDGDGLDVEGVGFEGMGGYLSYGQAQGLGHGQGM